MLESPQEQTDSTSIEGVDGETVRLGYVQWASAEASTHIVEEILTRMGYDVETSVLQTGAMWQGTAEGELDAFVSAWLPDTDSNYWDEFGDKLVDLNDNFDEAQIGIVVPEYVEADSLDELDEYADEFDEEIVGIDPGAAQMIVIDEETIPNYGLEDWDLIESSGPAMTAELARAIDNEEWVAVTGWMPHWKWAEWDLKFLDDPDLTMGDGEYIKNMGRPGIKDDLEPLADFLSNYQLTTEQLNSAMLEIEEEDRDPTDVAIDFIEDNPELVNEWVPGEEDIVS